MREFRTVQRFIYKIHSARLRAAKWSLTLPLEEARGNDEVVALADSQVLSWIDEMNGLRDYDERVRAIQRAIRRIRKEPYSAENKKAVKYLHRKLDKLQFKADYLTVIMDRRSDYYRACKGFSVNGVRYRRLLGTNGGIKNSTIVFVSEAVHDELERRIENGRNTSAELVTAKLEAYRALTCSASIPVSYPNGILIVPDCVTNFKADMVCLTDEGEGEPSMTMKKDADAELDASDGCGMMTPALARRWSRELGLDYVTGGVNTRYSFEKGMVFTFDFQEFARERAGERYIVRDAWGDEVDIRGVELVLTTSMVKLWDSYDSCADYLRNSIENGYTFRVAKVCPAALENERRLNYQFIQGFDLGDRDINALISPTINEFRDVLGQNPMSTVLFMKGMGLNEKNAGRLANDYVKALMIDERMAGDPFIQSSVARAMKRRLTEAKVGVLKVRGNYSIASGDLYALCQSIFGMRVTGLLHPGEIYNEYWREAGCGEVVCFRAPMSCPNNILRPRVTRSAAAAHWYRYMSTVTVFNAWDLSCAALNGMDFDGDMVMLTNNPVLLRRYRKLPPLVCEQRKAGKCRPGEEDFVRSNIASFGNDIGKTTNRITSMYEVRSHFPKRSKEYRELTYRIQCGQLYQQNAIDKAKGIICKPMPGEWYDKHRAAKVEGERERAFYRAIVADKKPYFMRYIYPALAKEYNTFVKNTDKNALREFGKTVAELKEIPYGDLSDRQKEFLRFYDKKMPVGVGGCVMNKICRAVEESFTGEKIRGLPRARFDYRNMRCDEAAAEYTAEEFEEVGRLYEEYNRRLKNYAVAAEYERADRDEAARVSEEAREEFRRRCDEVCPNAARLCNIILDLCYTHSYSKRFAWEMCGDEIIENLLAKNGRRLRVPVRDEKGKIRFGGERFSVKTIKCEEALSDEYCFSGERVGEERDCDEDAWAQTLGDAAARGEILP